MKKLFLFSAAALTALGYTACNNANDETNDADTTMVTSTTTATTPDPMTPAAETYVDLSTGAPVHKDEATGRYVADNNTPVDYYVNVTTHDTFYAETGQNTNNAMMHDDASGKWTYDKTKVQIQKDGDVKMTDGETTVKIDKDGDMKMEDKNGKTKIDADDGKVKRKD